jgi:hypothetical protein
MAAYLSASERVSTLRPLTSSNRGSPRDWTTWK